jgi:hypothetical protein
MTPRDFVWLQCRPLSAWGFWLLDYEGLEEPVLALPSRLALPDGAGWIPSAQRALGGGIVKLRLRCREADPFACVQLIATLAAALTGEVELWHWRRPREQLRCFLTDVPQISVRGPKEHTPSRDVELTFSRMDPGWIDRVPVVQALSATPVPVPVGRLATAPRVHLFGGSPAVQAPVVHVASATGQTIASAPLTGSLSTVQWLALEGATGDAQLTDNGVRSFQQQRLVKDAALPVLQGGDGFAGPFQAADPLVWLSASAGTPTGLLIGWRIS